MPKYYKHPTFKHVYGLPLTTPVARVSWPALVTPKPPMVIEGQKPGEPRYEVTLLLAKESPKTKIFLEEVKHMTDEMLDVFNEGRPSKLGECTLVKDGDTFDMEKYPYYQNSWVLSARNVNKPEIVDKEEKPYDAANIKGGNKVRLLVTPLITAHGVSYKMELVQFVSDDGTRFGGGVRDHKQFLGALEDEEDNLKPITEKELKKGKQAAIDML